MRFQYVAYSQHPGNSGIGTAGSRNREFGKSKVVSNDAKLLRYFFIRGNYAHFRCNRWETTDLSLGYVIKIS